MDTSPTAHKAPMWEEKRTERFVFFFEPDSYAARSIDDLAQWAESAYRRGWEWFGGDFPRPTISVYLAGWLPDAAGPGWVKLADGLVAVERNDIWLFVSPEQPGVGLERAVLEVLTRAAVRSLPRHARAEAPGSPRSPVGGALRALAGLLASQHSEKGAGLRAEEADRLAHERHVLGKAPLYLFAEDDGASALPADPAELSFLFFLERTHGRAALGRFARALLTDQPGAAAMRAYSKPLHALHKDWLAALRARRREITTWQDALRWVLPLLRPHWRRAVELSAYLIFNLLFGLAIPLSAKYLFDDIIVPRNYGLLPVWVVVVLAIFGVGTFVTYRRSVVGGLIGELILRDLRRAAFDRLQRLSQRFYTRSSTGDLLSRLTNDMDAIRAALAETLPVLLVQLLSLIVGAVALLLLNWQLGLFVLLLGAPVSAIVYARSSERLRQASRERQDRIGAMTAFVQENLSAQMVIKSFSLERRALAAFEQFLAQVFVGSMSMIGIGAMLFGGSFMVFLVIRVAVLAVGAALIMNGLMTVGTLVAFLEMIVHVLSPVSSISGLYQQLQSATGSLNRIQELMNEVPDIAEDPLAVELPDLQHEIRLERVTFRYGDGEAGLRDVSLAIAAGQRVAIVGPSGAGKTTLIALLLRLYDPDEGRIVFDGRDIRESTLASLRRQQALVPQDTFLFNTSILENIAIGREGATQEQAVEAAKAAAVHQVIERTDQGYQTLVGERGVRLSGGQRQRLAIARALLRDPRVLILDEATSALDPATEAALQDTLHDVGRGRTTVAITHRLTSVVDCDLIYVLDQGRLVEQGTHQELCQRRGLYWHLYSEQQAGVLETLALPVNPRRLAGVPLFASLSLSELAAMARRVSVEPYAAETVVVRQGDTADKLYVIVEGEVEVVMEDHRGEPRRIRVLGPRSYFGEIALLGGDSARRTATVRTITPVELYSLHKEDFLSLLNTHPTLAQTVSRLAQTRVEYSKQLAAAAGAVGGH